MVRELRIVVLNDNSPGKGLKNEWGLSIYIESEKWKILFDANSNERIIEFNSKKLNIDLESIDFAFLSHYHYDHYGGFSYFKKIKRRIDIFVPPGNTEVLREDNLNPIEINSFKNIAEDVWSSGPLGLINEQAMGILVDNTGLVVFVGCSHPGADNLTKSLYEKTGKEIYMVMGGYHLPSIKTLDSLLSISKFLAPGHCTGKDAYNYLISKDPDRIITIRTGFEIKIP